MTDCSLILGYIDPDFFLGGTMVLDRAAAATALKTKVADKLGLSVEEAAAAVFTLATEKMVGAIDEITVNQGIDPATAVLIGGGGAAGLNAVAVGRRLGCAGVLIPEAGSVLSAAGALMSDVSSDYAQMLFTTSRRFAFDEVNGVLAGLEERCRVFAQGRAPALSRSRWSSRSKRAMRTRSGRSRCRWRRAGSTARPIWKP